MLLKLHRTLICTNNPPPHPALRNMCCWWLEWPGRPLCLSPVITPDRSVPLCCNSYLVKWAMKLMCHSVATLMKQMIFNTLASLFQRIWQMLIISNPEELWPIELGWRHFIIRRERSVLTDLKKKKKKKKSLDKVNKQTLFVFMTE